MSSVFFNYKLIRLSWCKTSRVLFSLFWTLRNLDTWKPVENGEFALKLSVVCIIVVKVKLATSTTANKRRDFRLKFQSCFFLKWQVFRTHYSREMESDFDCSATLLKSVNNLIVAGFVLKPRALTRFIRDNWRVRFVANGFSVISDSKSRSVTSSTGLCTISFVFPDCQHEWLDTPVALDEMVKTFSTCWFFGANFCGKTVESSFPRVSKLCSHGTLDEV